MRRISLTVQDSEHRPEPHRQRLGRDAACLTDRVHFCFRSGLGQGTPRSPGCPDYDAALGRGRKATAEKRFEDAVRAFDDAVRARTVDARARAERGYAYLQWGRPDDARTDFQDAKALRREPSVRAQTWFNIALAFEKLGDAERERVALAAAAKLGSNAAKTRLGSRSTCAALYNVLANGPKAPVAKGFKELADARALACELPEPPKGATEAEKA